MLVNIVVSVYDTMGAELNSKHTAARKMFVGGLTIPHAKTIPCLSKSSFCGGYSRNGGEPICWEGYSVIEDYKVETKRLTDKRTAWFAAFQMHDLSKTILRGKEPVEEWTDA